MLWKSVQKELDKKHWSLAKLSMLTKIPDSSLRMYKYRGSDPSFSNACKIADALGLSLDDLRGDKNEI